MMKNNSFSKTQHGFLPRWSCITQLLVVTEYWSKALNHGDSVDIIYFDFKKAFDSVSHKRPLKHMALMVHCFIGLNTF